ncbi:glycoside hydrolase family 88/105 protein [Ferruginibacter sp. SUN106]|uniref:glycoside hydrolase family 88/105 protein n=1 Tax=Ferruginibacter sp. SUN106 TaxID=2978348 RepID=UPI003D35B4C0
MKCIKAFLVISACLLAVQSTTAQQLAAKKDVLKTITLANKYFMDKWPDAGKPIFVPSRNRTWPSHIWTRAVYYEGLMALYSVDKQKAYYNYAVDWSAKHNWSLRDGIKTRNGDNQACGQTYIDLYTIDKNKTHIDSIKASVDLMLQSSKIDDWHWVDAIQMAMPVFAKLGVIYKDTNYFHRMYEMYAYTRNKHGDNGLFNAAEGLWWRDKDFDPPYKEPNGEDCYWSRGNGWVVAALVRVLSNIPKNEPHRAEYVSDYKAMMAALIPIQRNDGYWNASLHDSTNFGGKELTGTSLFVYGMAWGINNKILDRATYLPIVTKAWNAMAKESVHANGFLGWVQGTGKEPKESQPVTYDREPDFEDFGLGCFLLAGSEVYKIKR